MKHTLRELAQAIGAQVSPRFEAVEVSGVASLASARTGDLAFIEDAKMLEAALASQAGAIVAPASLASDGIAKPMLLAKSPRLAFVRAAAMLVETADAQLGVHPTAVVHPEAKLALGVAVGPHGVVQRGATIAARTQLGANVFVGAGVTIGSACRIAANVTIYPHTRLGDRVVIHAGAVLGSDGFGFVRDPESGKYEKFPQVGTLEIADDVEIGANCTIDRGALDATVIGRGVKLDNLVHIGHNVRLGENVVIAAQTGVSGSSVIGDNVIIGGQVGIADHVTIESGAILGGQCGVPSGKVIRGAGVVFWGTPARPLKQHLRELATLARLAEKGKK